MHFYGDFCLGGNEYIKVSEFLIRHLPKLDDLWLKKKTYYPIIYQQIAESKMIEDVEELDFSFLQDEPDLKIWH